MAARSKSTRRGTAKRKTTGRGGKPSARQTAKGQTTKGKAGKTPARQSGARRVAKKASRAKVATTRRSTSAERELPAARAVESSPPDPLRAAARSFAARHLV